MGFEAERPPHRGPPTGDGLAVSVELDRLVDALGDRVDLEGRLRRVDAAQLAALDGRGNLVLEDALPAAADRPDLVADRARAGVEVRRGLGQKATTRKARPGEVIEPGVDDRLESRQSRLGSGGRVPYLGAEDRRRAVEGLELEALLASERTDDSGLAHPQPLGERADRDPVEPGDRGLADDLAEDRLAGPFGGFA